MVENTGERGKMESNMRKENSGTQKKTVGKKDFGMKEKE